MVDVRYLRAAAGALTLPTLALGVGGAMTELSSSLDKTAFPEA